MQVIKIETNKTTIRKEKTMENQQQLLKKIKITANTIKEYKGDLKELIKINEANEQKLKHLEKLIELETLDLIFLGLKA